MIRPAVPGDIAALTQLAHEVHAGYVPHHHVAKPGPAPDFRKQIGAGHVHVWTQGPRILAYILSHADPPLYFIDEIGTTREAHMTHLAHDLLIWAEGRGLAENCHAVALADTPLMAPHADTMHRLGFADLGSADNPQGHRAFSMRHR